MYVYVCLLFKYAFMQACLYLLVCIHKCMLALLHAGSFHGVPFGAARICLPRLRCRLSALTPASFPSSAFPHLRPLASSARPLLAIHPVHFPCYQLSKQSYYIRYYIAVPIVPRCAFSVFLFPLNWSHFCLHFVHVHSILTALVFFFSFFILSFLSFFLSISKLIYFLFFLFSKCFLSHFSRFYGVLTYIVGSACFPSDLRTSQTLS